MGEPRFSIIIPVYNVEKYIRRCMASVMNQTYRDYEVIVVDDESPDNSMRIVEEFARTYPGMITMIHQKNTRQGGARNRGVREARGEYLLFVDSDDYVSEKLLEKMDARLRESPCDILVFQHLLVTEDGKKIGRGDIGSLLPGTYIPQEDKAVLRIACQPWGKVISRSFYLESNFAFPEKILYEDAIMRVLYAKASRVVVCDECLYYYVQSRNSSIRQKPSDRMLDILKMADLVRERFQADGLYAFFQEELDSVSLTGILFVFDLINKAERTSSLQDAIADYIQKKYEDFENNPSISSENKAAIHCVMSRNYTRYYFRFLLKREAVEWIMRMPPVFALNRFRKQILSKK